MSFRGFRRGLQGTGRMGHFPVGVRVGGAAGIPLGVGLMQLDAASMLADGIAAVDDTIPYVRDYGAHGLADSTTQGSVGSRMIMRAGGPTGAYVESRRSRLNSYQWPGLSSMPSTAQPYYLSFLMRRDVATASGQSNLIAIGATGPTPIYQHGSYFTAGQKARFYAGTDTPSTVEGTWPLNADWQVATFKAHGTSSWFRLNRGTQWPYLTNGQYAGGNPGSAAVPTGTPSFGINNSSCPAVDYAHIFVTASLADLEAFEDAAAVLAGIELGS